MILVDGRAVHSEHWCDRIMLIDSSQTIRQRDVKRYEYQDQLNIDEYTRSWPFVHIHIHPFMLRGLARGDIAFEHLSAIVFFSAEPVWMCTHDCYERRIHFMRRRYVSSFVTGEARATTIWMIWCDNGAEFMPKLSNPTKKPNERTHENRTQKRK